MMPAAAALAEDSGEALARDLRRHGYCILRGIAPASSIEALAAELAPTFARTPFCQGYFNGYRTKRFHGLLKRSGGAAALVLDGTVLDLAGRMLLPHCETLQLNLTQAIEIHPGELAQVPHRDEGMWPGEKRGTEYMLNVIWPLGRFTRANGATRIWPGSNRDRDAAAAGDPVAPELAPGDALVFLGSTLHGAGANRADEIRRGILVSYCLGWLKPYENMWLTYPPEVARGFPPELSRLVGYCQHKPNLGNYDGQCPSIL
ncbi:MAG: phytanoyl-CoA dioxygenase family protein, partial [Pseudomonadota bacterium]|nr:phytanoyl-CoA dioxygenase family protein [Pseudomonadota bacterium]